VEEGHMLLQVADQAGIHDQHKEALVLALTEKQEAFLANLSEVDREEGVVPMEVEGVIVSQKKDILITVYLEKKMRLFLL